MKAINAIVLPALLANGVLAGFSGFMGNCKFMAFSRGKDEKNPAIIYECPLKDGAEWPHISCSMVQLNDCFANRGGKLVISERGNFGHSCENCRYDPDNGVLDCQCGDGAGGKKDTYIWIGESVRTAAYGKVHCYGIIPGANCNF
ncbi:hypothetical protein CPLU01_11855 [Colletotrichum plurivorum]|uniref:Cyanovirin-N domain-containing protein n=1 Tax=Colletotrichum plurivorum TaxID=2175906 RepID=A0A8H6K112_9PEZI|nr:hypothetical protein CPLU01_11855 [Colletotrichum plurivorum]